MDSVPLIPKAKILPNSDASPLIREFFQEEIESAFRGGLSKKLSETIMTSLQYNGPSDEMLDSKKTIESLEAFRRRENLLSFSENVFKAYVKHEEESDDIRKAEKNLFETHAQYLKREAILLENKTYQELYILKRQPHLKALDANHVKKYKLLEGEASLPPLYQANIDFRVENFGKWKKRLNSLSQDSVIMNHVKRETVAVLTRAQTKSCLSITDLKPDLVSPKIKKPRPKAMKLNKRTAEVFRAEPKIVFFTGYKPGDVYTAGIEVQNIHTKGMLFQVKPTSPNGPFQVYLKNSITSKKLYPGLSFQLMVEFAPKSLDVVAEDIYIAIEEDKKLLIPLVAYLEPPILKTHQDINEFTKLTAEKIASSFIECGACFTGDTKVTKLRFKCYRGSGEFFVMSSENWNRNYVNTVTNENFLEISPFRVYPVYFKIEKNEAIDLFVEFFPKISGTHVENIMIACDNGEVRSLDLLGDAIGWHSYFFSFQDDLLKELPVDSEDDPRVKYYIDFGDTTPMGKVTKSFSIRNNSNMSFEYQWKIREVNITSRRKKYLKLSKYQVKVEPESGTLDPNEIHNFNVLINFAGAEIGEYRMVLSLYVLNLPYQCIEEDTTIIQPTGLVRNLYSQSLYGEEEFTTPSPELLSLQGTYESLQESIKSYVEYQSKSQAYVKNDFCRTMCLPNPGLCAKPLKKSKTYFNIGDNIDDEGLSCACRGHVRTEESNSDTCTSNEKIIDNGPKNEVIWDFVDILVDEIELWVEVEPIRITLEPRFIELPDIILDTPILEKVRIINYSQSSAKCRWILPETESEGPKKSIAVTIVPHQGDQRDDCTTPAPSGKAEKNSKSSLNTLMTKFLGDESSDYESAGMSGMNDESGNEFDVSGLSETVSIVKLIIDRPGKFQKILILSIDDDSQKLTLFIQGNAVGKFFSVEPHIIDFKAVKQGTRLKRQYEIKNEYSHPISVTTNQYDFDFAEETFNDVSESKALENFTFDLETENSTTKSFFLDARAAGLKFTILEFSAECPEIEFSDSQYVLVLGDVRVPALSLMSSRFKNAILAPSGMMYVGKSVTSKVTLFNRGNVNTIFTWGPPFGCHSRKINVSIHPENGKINRRQKLPLEVVITPLDEGIIDHCYVPCYFCRSTRPLILSIVGIISKVSVTFELVESKTPGTTVRIPWPMKNYDPNLGQTYKKEAEILYMKCQCFEVEEEANRAFGGPATPRQDSSAIESSRVSETRNDQKLTFGVLPVKTNNLSSEENIERSFSGSDSDKKISREKEKSYCVQKFASQEYFTGGLQLIDAELEFLNVFYGSRVTKQFVIRNETPVQTKFRIRVKNFGKSDKKTENSILAIKKKILGSENQDENRQAVLLEVNPSEGDLHGLEAVCINVTATGNTWGEYRDVIFCQINGIRTFDLKAFVQILGHPFYFPMFENFPVAKPVLRFQPVTQVSQPATKKIRVINRSSIPITITWLIFLTQPFSKEEEHENSFNLCLESNAYLDSNHSEGSTKSVKVYLPKNISESASTFRNMLEMRDFSQNSGTFESFGKGDVLSDKNEMQDSCDGREKSRQDCAAPSPTEIRSDSQQFMFRIDIHNFRVDPKELYFDAFEEKKITVTFDPRFCKIKNNSQEFRAVLTGSVKLKPSDEKCPGLFYRPTGMNFLSEIMELNAIVETPLLSFEILKGDLRFHVDANEILKSSSKKISLSRKYLFQNNNQGSINLKIEISPGSIFRIKKVETIDESHRKYNPEINKLFIKPGEYLEVELECAVTYKGVTYAYEQLKLNRRKELNASCSEETKLSEDTAEDPKQIKEPWNEYFNPTLARSPRTPGNSSIEPKDSFNINLNRMSTKSDSSVCYDYYYGEIEGEELGLPPSEGSPRKPKIFQHVIVVEEEINFVQTGLVTQTILAELHLSFPALRISPKTLDMGNVYIGETAVRYCSLVNLTGSPTDFKLESKCNVKEFAVEPLAGNLPNYNSDIGKTLTVRFTPRQPGHLVETYQIYCNPEREFDCCELSVSGIGTWNEKYKKIKFESDVQLRGVYPHLTPDN